MLEEKEEIVEEVLTKEQGKKDDYIMLASIYSTNICRVLYATSVQ